MPIDGSGNFSRSYDFEQDRIDGLKILSARVDGEFDNYASALNTAFWRTGIVPMSGNLKLGANAITGIGSGSAGSPSTQFTSDPATGLYLPGSNRLGVSVGGSLVGEFNAGGLNTAQGARIQGAGTQGAGAGLELNYNGTAGIIRAYDRTGAAFIPMQLLASAVTIAPSGGTVGYFDGSGLSITGNLSTSGTTYFDDTTYSAYVTGTNAVFLFDTSDYLAYDRSANQLQFAIGNSTKFTLNGTGGAFAGTLGVTGLTTLVSLTATGNATVNGSLSVLTDVAVSGQLSHTGAGQYTYHSGSRSSAKITTSTSAPSGGSDGDIWYQY